MRCIYTSLWVFLYVDDTSQYSHSSPIYLCVHKCNFLSLSLPLTHSHAHIIIFELHLCFSSRPFPCTFNVLWRESIWACPCTLLLIKTYEHPWMCVHIACSSFLVPVHALVRWSWKFDESWSTKATSPTEGTMSRYSGSSFCRQENLEYSSSLSVGSGTRPPVRKRSHNMNMWRRNTCVWEIWNRIHRERERERERGAQRMSILTEWQQLQMTTNIYKRLQSHFI